MLLSSVKYLLYDIAGLTEGERLSAVVEFFVYDTIKIFFLLSAIIFAVALIRSYFPPERAKRILSHKKAFMGNISAALLGVVTPFCSCSAVPLFIGFMEAGVPLGASFSFIISSPMVNEVAVVLLWGLFGWKVAALYVSAGLVIAVAGGYTIGRMGLEKWVEKPEPPNLLGKGGLKLTVIKSEEQPGFRERLAFARSSAGGILKSIWIYVVIAIGIGAVIHGYVPQDFLARHAGRDNPLAVPLAVLVGVPLYSSCGGLLPIAGALASKGMGMGTVLAFMMAVTALSLPEMILLRRVLKVRLLAVFAGLMAVSIIAVGYMFNLIL